MYSTNLLINKYFGWHIIQAWAKNAHFGSHISLSNYSFRILVFGLNTDHDYIFDLLAVKWYSVNLNTQRRDFLLPDVEFLHFFLFGCNFYLLKGKSSQYAIVVIKYLQIGLLDLFLFFFLIFNYWAATIT